jgi:hypothetical protein
MTDKGIAVLRSDIAALQATTDLLAEQVRALHEDLHDRMVRIEVRQVKAYAIKRRGRSLAAVSPDP